MSSNIDYETVVISVIISIILSTGTIMTVPQVQDALRGPPGTPGPQGEPGPPGKCEVPQDELDELAVRIDELESKIAEIENYIQVEIIGFEWSEVMQVPPPEWDTLHNLTSRLYNLENTLDYWIDYFDDELIPKVSHLETRQTPNFDSGWRTLSADEELILSFDTSVIYDHENTLVFVQGAFEHEGKLTVNHRSYGGDYKEGIPDGVYWYLDEGYIFLYNLCPPEYESFNKWEQVRVRIWQLPPP